MSNVNGLYAIAVIDRDGVPLMKCKLKRSVHAHLVFLSSPAATKDSIPEVAMRPYFLASGSQTIEQSGKLGVGRCKTMICEFEQHQVINFNIHPFTISLIASRKANTGHLLSLEPSFLPVVEELAKLFDNC